QEEDEKKAPPLPPLSKGEKLKYETISPLSHETQPPPRYNEASLIQKLEKEGVGRPSTYAPIISTIQNRGYVQKVNKTLAPTFTALVVTNFLGEHFPDYVDIKFTSEMEKTLDNIASGKTDHTKYLASIYKGKKGLKKQVEKQEASLNGKDSRSLTLKPFKGIRFHVGRFGAYISQKEKKEEIKASLPKDLFPADLSPEKISDLIQAKKTKDKVFGIHPKTKEKIFIKTGRYGPYLETEQSEKRSAIPSFLSPNEITLAQAIQLLELPKILGIHPETKKEIKKSIGRFGPYIVHEGDFRSVPASESFLALSLKEAIKILSQPKNQKRGSTRKTKALREFKDGKDTIQVFSGRYGPYIKFKNRNISLPEGLQPETLTLESALEIINKKLGGKASKKTRPSGKKRKTSGAQKARSSSASTKKKKTSKTKKKR
ncbi:MAG: DNA topoisomerase, partial [Bdellovibrionales bacterium]|nr:DNA topoisomerase [Bdellovibrionales bacterium]